MAFAMPSAGVRGEEVNATGDVKLAFAGDIMLADRPGKLIEQGKDPFAEFAGVFAAADAAIGNLECVVATVGEAVEKPYTFRADPRVLPVLARHFGIVSLANNHTGDFGHAAFLQQLELLRRNEIKWFGGGPNCAAARMPVLLEKKGLRIALLGYNEFIPRSFEAGPTWPGVAWSVDEQVVADIKAARTGQHADLVIPVMHWGWEYEAACERQQKLARLLIDAGADAVIGGHPHVTQSAELYHGKLIIYSLGNFVFDGFDDGPERFGWVLRLRLGRQGVVAWDTMVARQDDDGMPRLRRDVASPYGVAGSERIQERPAPVEWP